MKKFFLALIIGFLFCFVINSRITATQTALADGVIRLHVVANSDTAEDQALKLKVRNRVLSQAGIVSHDDMDTVSYEICKNIEQIKKCAEDEIKKNGYDYKVKVSYGLSDFPDKKYGNIVLPEGKYQALKIEIGEAKGQNWWCVMFPPLCFVTEECVKMDDTSQVALKTNVGDNAYNLINNPDGEYNVKFKIYELWQEGQRLIANLW